MIFAQAKYSLFFVVALALAMGQPAAAQDAHFSQPMAAPLWLNPALSGADGYMRGALSYRTQWNAVSDPFTTTAGSFDIALNQRPDPRKKKMGKPALGISFLTDRAGDPVMRNTHVMLSGAYHVNLNKYSNLGVALSAGYRSQSLDAKTGKWGSQYNGMQYDPNLGHGEDLSGVQRTSLDLGGGMVYSYRRETNVRHRIKRREITIGVAGYQLGRLMLRDEDMFTDNDEMRISGFVNTAFGVGNSGSAIEPAVYYHRQGPSQMILAGMAYRYMLSSGKPLVRNTKSMSIALGGFYRVGDAVVAQVSFSWDALEIGFSYDINTSGLSTYSSGQGAIEFALRYRVRRSSFRR